MNLLLWNTRENNEPFNNSKKNYNIVKEKHFCQSSTYFLYLVINTYIRFVPALSKQKQLITSRLKCMTEAFYVQNAQNLYNVVLWPNLKKYERYFLRN